MELFYLNRLTDVSGTSGTGRVAEGVIFDDGTVALRWLTKTSSTAVYNNIHAVEEIHGHDGRTVIEYASPGHEFGV